jgi:hypothetical protein
MQHVGQAPGCELWVRRFVKIFRHPSGRSMRTDYETATPDRINKYAMNA